MKRKILASVFAATFSLGAFAVCSSPISRTTAGFESILTSARYNSELNTVFNRANNLPGDCITDGTISSAKLAAGSVTTSKIADGAITSAKLAEGAIPAAGRLIRVLAFTASGTWTRESDMGSVLIHVIGGGGASYHASATNGGASSFGSHCTGNGGSKPSGASGAGGAGGTATGGDINLTGGNGEYAGTSNSVPFGGAGGVSQIGSYGHGGVGSLPSNHSPGGGAGGYCSKLIQRANLNATETVTIGAGGTNPGSNTTAGQAGIVLVYEYSL